MTTSIRFASAVSGCLLLAAVARAGDASPFEAVKDGVLKVYTIDDLTDGQTDIAEQIGKVIREINNGDRWTDKGGTAAAMRVTAERLTVKAPTAMQRNIKSLLDVMRKGRTLHVQVEYRVVDSAALRPRTLGPADRIDAVSPYPATPASDRVRAKAGLPRPAESMIPEHNLFQVVDAGTLPADAKTVLDSSEVTVRNGDEAVWIDGVGLPLPTIRGQATVSADRRFATLTLSTAAGAVTTRITQSLPFGKTGAMPLNEQHTRWLLFTPTLMLTQTKPA